jgi:hypothetical protein
MGTATPVTGETTWLELLARKAEWGPPCIPTVVISPHPDDETLGAGGLIASQCRKGEPILQPGFILFPRDAIYPRRCLSL